MIVILIGLRGPRRLVKLILVGLQGRVRAGITKGEKKLCSECRQHQPIGSGPDGIKERREASYHRYSLSLLSSTTCFLAAAT